MSDLALQAHRRRREFQQAIFSKSVLDDGIDLKRLKPGFRYQGETDAPAPSITPQMVDLCLSGTVEGRFPFDFGGEGKPPCFKDIKRAVCAVYKISSADLLSHRRTADIVLPRQVAMWFCRKLSLKSLPAIGQFFAGRDHTTVIHSVERIERKIASDGGTKARILEVAAYLRETGFVVELDWGAA